MKSGVKSKVAAGVLMLCSIGALTVRADPDMVQWLEQDYHLTASEAALVLGSSAEYRISEIADRDASVVLKLRKDLLQNVTTSPKE